MRDLISTIPQLRQEGVFWTLCGQKNTSTVGALWRDFAGLNQHNPAAAPGRGFLGAVRTEKHFHGGGAVEGFCGT